MSKSKIHEWSDLPNWKNENEYTFLKEAPLQHCAWEFLRRVPDYSNDWKELFAAKKGGQLTHIYVPKKLEGESDEAWEIRSNVFEEREPKKYTLDQFLSKKWGIKTMQNPQTPYSDQIHIFPPETFIPDLLTLPDHFEQYVKDDEDIGTPVVAAQFGIIAFDISYNLTEQLKQAKSILLKHQEKMINAGAADKARGHSGHRATWARHLRVIDALRTNPEVSFLEIAQTLGGNSDSKEGLRSEGKNFRRYAMDCMHNYRKILLSQQV